MEQDGGALAKRYSQLERNVIRSLNGREAAKLTIPTLCQTKDIGSTIYAHRIKALEQGE